MKNLSDTITNNIKKHLIQPWPYASSIGDEYRDIVTNGDGIYIEDKNGNKYNLFITFGSNVRVAYYIQGYYF